ncbi:unnamed protein product [Coffea canephora]|uniref:Lipid-binding serum glycoprotein C-terminal domain-containing protein n=1 Tax=Coffea canephora TaxID=49390 RepID=A0A068UZ26_COFCA|nr:unnamed protein product [Coffea canephora]
MGHSVDSAGLLVVLWLMLSSWAYVGSSEGYISYEISDKGLDFVKDLLIEKAETSLVPLELPNIEKTVKIPVIGTVSMEVSNVTLYRVHVTSSTVKTGDTGILVDVAGATANLTMHWGYSYSTWLLPISISDQGEAEVQIEGMEIGLLLDLKNQQGSLKLSLVDCGCYVKDLSIDLAGGASWLYQGLVDAFEDKIASAVEDAVLKKLIGAIQELDSFLQSLPKEVTVNNISALNVTIVGDPKLSNSSLELEINGLFSLKDEAAVSKLQRENVEVPFSCNGPARMVGISVHENVLESASAVYFEANKMHWIVDNIPDQNLMNTAEWRFIIPQLYKQYPNDDLNLNISVHSNPILKIGEKQIDATIPLKVIIDVLDDGQVVPVACISVVISAAAYPEVSCNALAVSVKLNEFTMSQDWSKIGNLHMYLVQPVISTLLRTVVLPYINLKLSKGFPIPIFHGFELQNTELLCTDSRIIIGSDVAFIETAQPHTVFV